MNIESKSDELKIQLYNCHDINMKSLAVVTPPSIYQLPLLPHTTSPLVSRMSLMPYIIPSSISLIEKILTVQPITYPVSSYSSLPSTYNLPHMDAMSQIFVIRSKELNLLASSGINTQPGTILYRFFKHVIYHAI